MFSWVTLNRLNTERGEQTLEFICCRLADAISLTMCWLYITIFILNFHQGNMFWFFFLFLLRALVSHWKHYGSRTPAAQIVFSQQVGRRSPQTRRIDIITPFCLQARDIPSPETLNGAATRLSDPLKVWCHFRKDFRLFDFTLPGREKQSNKAKGVLARVTLTDCGLTAHSRFKNNQNHATPADS